MTGRSTSFVVGHGRTPQVDLHRSCIQGSVLGPLLFLLGIDPLLATLQKLPGISLMRNGIRTDKGLGVQGFLDDIVIAADSHEQLQTALNTLTEWVETKMSMLINPAKSVFWACGTDATGLTVRIGHHDNPPVNQLDPNDPFKYLGVTMTPSLNWGPQEKVLDNKIAQPLARIRFASLTPPQTSLAVSALVMSVIGYVARHAILSDSWISKTAIRIRRAAKSAMRWSHGVGNGAMTSKLYGAAIPDLQQVLDHQRTQHFIERLNMADESPSGAITAMRLRHFLTTQGASKYAMAGLFTTPVNNRKGWSSTDSQWAHFTPIASLTQLGIEADLQALGRCGLSISLREGSRLLEEDRAVDPLDRFIPFAEWSQRFPRALQEWASIRMLVDTDPKSPDHGNILPKSVLPTSNEFRITSKEYAVLIDLVCVKNSTRVRTEFYESSDKAPPFFHARKGEPADDTEACIRVGSVVIWAPSPEGDDAFYGEVVQTHHPVLRQAIQGPGAGNPEVIKATLTPSDGDEMVVTLRWLQSEEGTNWGHHVSLLVPASDKELSLEHPHPPNNEGLFTEVPINQLYPIPSDIDRINTTLPSSNQDPTWHVPKTKRKPRRQAPSAKPNRPRRASATPYSHPTPPPPTTTASASSNPVQPAALVTSH